MNERLARLETHMQAALKTLDEHLKDCALARKESNARFMRLERIIWSAAGATAVIISIIRWVLT